jgi:LysR family glycine cleavage system transcriptional activator
MARSLPPLAAVRAFEAAARHLNFTRAADELGMTQAAVSYQIRLLEDRVGGPLFSRQPRGVALTDTGARLAPAVSEAFSRLRSAFEDVDQAAGGVLTVSVTETFAANWLVPRLGAFQVANPAFAVRLRVEARLVDFAREDVDVAVRTGDGAWSNLAAHRLMELSYAPMLSPALLKATPVKSPIDLLKLPLVDPADPWWADWFSAAGVDPGDVLDRPGVHLDTQALAGTVALAGHGVAMLSPVFFAAELASGRLIQPLPLTRTDTRSYWLVYPESRRRSPRIRAFRDWILAEIGAAGDAPKT